MNFHNSSHTLNPKQISRQEYDRLKDKINTYVSELAKLQEEIQSTRSSKYKKIDKEASLLFLITQYDIKKKKLAKLKKEIDNCIVGYEENGTNVITIGDKGIYKIIHSANNIDYKPFHLVANSPNPLKDEISIESPIGNFILGKSVGDSGKVILSDNSIATIEIISKN